MKRFFIYGLIALSASLFAACGEPAEEPQTAFGIIGSDVNLPTVGGRGYIAVNRTEGYSAVSAESWCELTVEADTVWLDVAENAALTGRNALVTISGSFGQKYVNVSQAGQQVDLSEIPETQVIGYQGGTATYTIVSNVDIAITNSAEWVDISREGDVMTITVDESLLLDDRTAEFSFATATATKTVRLLQTGRFKLATDKIEVPKKGSTVNIALISADTFILLCDDTDWCHSTYDSAKSVLTITCDKFLSTERSRTTKITIITSVGNRKTIDITQQLNYYDYVGSWMMEFRWTDDYETYDHEENPDEYLHVNITMQPLVAGETLYLKGFFIDDSRFKIVLDYDEETGKCYLGAQKIGVISDTNPMGTMWLTVHGNECDATGKLPSNPSDIVYAGMTYESDCKFELSWNSALTNLTVTPCEKSIFKVYQAVSYKDENGRYKYRDVYGNATYFCNYGVGSWMEIFNYYRYDGATDFTPHYCTSSGSVALPDYCYVASRSMMLYHPITFKRSIQ